MGEKLFLIVLLHETVVEVQEVETCDQHPNNIYFKPVAERTYNLGITRKASLSLDTQWHAYLVNPETLFP